MSELKERIKGFWNKKPCGTFGVVPNDPDKLYFEEIKKRRHALEPFISDFIKKLDVNGKKTLEIGCGVGTDGTTIAGFGAKYTGIDRSEVSVGLAKKNFEIGGLEGNILSADAEDLPFESENFERIYSWGVLHHTPDMTKSFSEVYRVLEKRGKFCIMLYNRHSLVGLQLYLVYGLLRGKPFTTFTKLFAEHHESPDTKALTDDEAREYFSQFKNVKIENVVTPYDLRITRNKFLPKLFWNLVPSRFGFFKVITGEK